MTTSGTDERSASGGDASDEPTVALATGPAEDAGAADDDELEAMLALARARSRLTGVEEPVRLGHYRIGKRLGSGGMGVVYEAVDENLGRVVAIKLLRPDRAGGSAGRSRLLREAQAAARLSHPNVAQVHEIAEDDGRLFLVMERVHGETLRHWCAAERREWPSILAMFLEAGRGLAAAHAVGLVHRDFKPDNVLVGADGRPRIVDFGLARADDVNERGDTASHMPISPLDSESALPITATGTVMGTPAYMAPEQYAGGLADARADQFAFCVALFESLYGRRPFAGATITELAKAMTHATARAPTKAERGTVPTPVYTAILRGLSAAPEQRFATLDDLLAALAKGGASRRRLWPIGAAATVAAAAAVVVLASRPPSDASDEAADANDPWAEIVAASGQPDPLSESLPGDPASVTIHRLKNGLTVYISRRPGEPRVVAELVIRAGAVEEGPDHAGASGCMPELLFEGTERLGVRDLALERPQLVLQHAILERLDAVDDEAAKDAMIVLADAAHTGSRDQIVSQDVKQLFDRLGPHWSTWTDDSHSAIGLDMPRNRFAGWAAMTAELVRRPVFRGMPRATGYCLGAATWEWHNQRARSVIKHELWRLRGLDFDVEKMIAGVRAMRLASVRSYHATWYVPNNAAVVLVGDISPAEALPVIEREFGDWEPRELPAHEMQPVPAGATERHVIEDGGGPLLDLAFPLPIDAPPELEALRAALPGRDGLLARLAGDSAEFELVATPRALWVVARPRPDHDLAETERAVLAAIATIADDRVPADVWTDALASAELTGLAWAKTPASLADRIALAYVERSPWSDVAGRLVARPTREDVVAAAKWLRDRTAVIVHQNPGAPWSVKMRPMPIPVTQSGTGRSSELANTLVQADRTAVEPRFLVPGAHFQIEPLGSGRIIRSTDDGPLFHLTWVAPIGADRDPWACDAVRAKIASARLPGLEVAEHCSTAQTQITIVGPAHAWPQVWPKIQSWLASDELDAKAVTDHITATLRDRVAVRENAFKSLMPLYTWFLRGEHALDAKLPRDETLERRGATEIPRALRELVATEPDLLYAGPQPEALKMTAPATSRPRQKPGPLLLRAIDRPTVVVFDEPLREAAEVWVATPSRERDPDGQVLALVYNYLHSDPAQDGTMMPSFMPHYYAPEPSAAPILHSFVYRGLRYDDVVGAIEAGVAELQLRPSKHIFEVARDSLENDFRWYRVPNGDVPTHVARWLDPSAGDPRMRQWQRLPALSYEEFTRYTDQLAAQLPLIGVLGDRSKLDLDALARFGTIIEANSSIIRDPNRNEGEDLGVW